MKHATKPPPEEVVRRLAYILDKAWCEAILISDDSQRIFELADTMHNAPAMLRNCDESWLQAQREDFLRYCNKYPSTPDYARFLDQGVPEDSEWPLLWDDPGTEAR